MSQWSVCPPTAPPERGFKFPTDEAKDKYVEEQKAMAVAMGRHWRCTTWQKTSGGSWIRREEVCV